MFTFDDNYDDYCDFHEDDEMMMCADDEDNYDDLDGDHETGFASAGWRGVKDSLVFSKE